MTCPLIHAGQKAPTLAYQSQDVYQTSAMRCLPQELFVKIIQLAMAETNSPPGLALVCRHWKQIIYTIHPFHLLKQRRFAFSLKNFYLYSHIKNKGQVDKINQALKGWLPAFMINCRNAKQAAFTLENMWLTPFSTRIISPNRALDTILALLRQLEISEYVPQRHLSVFLRVYDFLPFSTRLLITAIQLGYLSLQDIPQNLRCYAICLAAVQQNGWAIQHVPEELKTPELCLAAVQRHGIALQHVPGELKTPELCLAAVQENGVALQHVPEELKTPTVCLAAIQEAGCGFTPFVKDSAVCSLIPRHIIAYRILLSLASVPEELKTPELFLAAVQQNGWVLEYVPTDLKTQRLCLAAVKQNGLALQFVPRELQNPDVCLTAVQQNGFAFQFVTEELQTLDVCLAAVHQNGRALGVVLEEFRKTLLNQRSAVEQKDLLALAKIIYLTILQWIIATFQRIR